MIYYLTEILKDKIMYGEQISNLFSYISFRSALAVIFSLIITTYFGKSIIIFLQKKSVGENIRNLELNGEKQKEGIPTMGGLIILLGILVPTFLLCELNNIYVILMILTSIWMGCIGFVDDYIKVFKKKKKGLAGRFKIFGQIVLGCVVSIILYFHPSVTVQEKNPLTSSTKNNTEIINDNFIINEVFQEEKNLQILRFLF